jgi:lipopolysaccharide transport system ATP-binding protein
VGTGFHPELTGRENIFLNGAILGMRRVEIRKKFDEIVAFAEVEEFVDTPVKHYSSGMYVRLAFAVAAHLQPETLVVDEVLAVGDAAFQKKCIGKMGDVAKEGRTVLFVSHNMFSLQNLCSRGILLESGRKTLEGSIAEVISRYMDAGKEQHGEVFWVSLDEAPGDDRARLKAVRVVASGIVSGEVDIEKDFRVDVEYQNLESNGRRMVSIHIYNAMGVCVFTSANLPSVTLGTDPWCSRVYPQGLFRTSCTVPGGLLNEGAYHISVFLNGQNVADHIVALRDVLRFIVQDTGGMRKEYTGPWLGTIRPRLAWQTVQLS